MEANTTSSSVHPGEHESEFCHPYPQAFFETLNTTVPYIVNVTLNIPSALVAIIANILVFIAVWHSTSVHLPSKLLLCSLVLTDLGVGLVVQPQYVMFLLMRVNKAHSIMCFLAKCSGFTAAVFSSVSLFTMTAISLDRYIALILCLKYHEIVTTRRVFLVLTFIWTFAVFYGSMWVWNKVLFGGFTLVFFIVCTPVISVAYVKIYQELRRLHGHQVHGQAQAEAKEQTKGTIDVVKYRRTASTMLLINVLFLLCFLPFFVSSLIARIHGYTLIFECIHELFLTLLYVNSCLNPLVYSFRFAEVRAPVLKILQRLSCQKPVE